ncbi:hypothetical protein JTB14_006625 [Gonioctena quinquepunctata]|nr:hypothetical protein JTB14_006625 [Gonioctena quinquepunctata]
MRDNQQIEMHAIKQVVSSNFLKSKQKQTNRRKNDENIQKHPPKTVLELKEDGQNIIEEITSQARAKARGFFLKIDKDFPKEILQKIKTEETLQSPNKIKEVEEFKAPKKVVKRTKEKAKIIQNVFLRKRFETLLDSKEKDQDEIHTEESIKQTQQEVTTPIITVKPLALDSKLNEAVKQGINGHFFKHSRQSTIIQTKDKEDYNKIKAYLQIEKIEHFTFTESENKTHASIIRGLSDPTVEEVKEDLEKAHGMKIIKVYRLRTD